MAEFELLAEVRLPSRHIADLVLQQVAWNRLEPQSRSGDPDPGIEARVHDPLWLLGRQWQFGEFQGEDCGTPVAVEVEAETVPVTGFRPAGEGAEPVAIGPEAVIEPWIEREPWAPPPLRDRAEASAVLLATLAPLGWAEEAALLAACPFDLADDDLAATEPDPSWRLIAARIPDAEKVALALEAGTPDWLDGAPEAAVTAAGEWLAWYRRNVSPRGWSAESWVRERLEYRFALQAGAGRSAVLLEAPLHDGGPVEWYSVDAQRGGAFLAEGEARAAEQHRATVHAGRLRYAGMPADRFWQFEDGRVNLGLTEVQPHDLARLCFLEFAVAYGNDWLVAPIDLPRGALATVTGVTYTTTFGERIRVDRAADLGGRGHFELFATSRAGGGLPGFLVPPGGRTALEGPVREEVVLARDESANLAWGIELRIEGADGLARERDRGEPPPPVEGDADLVYRLESPVPLNWIPLVPVPLGGAGGFKLRKGSFDGEDRALGRVLAGKPLDIFDEEVPREGVRVRRVPSLIRDEAGELVRWVARRVGPASGEAASHLAYDSALPRQR